MTWFHARCNEMVSCDLHRNWFSVYPFFMLLQLLAHMGEINQPWVRCANIKDLFCSLFYKTIKMHFWAWVHVIIFFTELSTRPSNHETSYWSVKVVDQYWNPCLKFLFLVQITIVWCINVAEVFRDSRVGNPTVSFASRRRLSTFPLATWRHASRSDQASLVSCGGWVVGESSFVHSCCTGY